MREECSCAEAGMGGATTSVMVSCVVEVVWRRAAMSSWPTKPPAPVIRMDIARSDLKIEERWRYSVELVHNSVVTPVSLEKRGMRKMIETDPGLPEKMPQLYEKNKSPTTL